MRLFVSIDFPESIRENVHSWVPEQKGWKKVSVYQLHLTLVFLGDSSEREEEEINKKLSEIEFTPFDLTIEGLGAFPTESSPRIIWAGVRENDQLMNLQEKVSDRLKDHIKSKHTDSYIPHITLARKKSRKGINHIEKKNIQENGGELTVQVKSFQLKQSILKPQGSEHKILHKYF